MQQMKHKHILFCEEYLKTLNATQSYLKVYNCTRKTAEVNSCKLLGNAKIQEYIQERIQKAEREKIADANEVLEFLTSTLRGEVKDQLGFETSVKDRIKAGELLGKRYKLFEDKDKTVNVENKITPKIQLEIIDNSELEKVLYENKDK